MDLERKPVDLGRKPALLLVDMINGFTDPNCSLGTDCPAVVAANATLLNEFRVCRLPVYFTTVVFDRADQSPVFRQRIGALNQLTPDSHWCQVDARLAPEAGETLVVKRAASAFHGTDLYQQLRAHGVDSLVITGLTTSGCVRATVVDGLQYNFPVWVPSEAVGDRNPAAHAANLFDMHAKYADVVTVQQVLARLNA